WNRQPSRRGNADQQQQSADGKGPHAGRVAGYERPQRNDQEYRREHQSKGAIARAFDRLAPGKIFVRTRQVRLAFDLSRESFYNADCTILACSAFGQDFLPAAQESSNATARLNFGAPGCESTRSATK